MWRVACQPPCIWQCNKGLLSALPGWFGKAHFSGTYLSDLIIAVLMYASGKARGHVPAILDYSCGGPTVSSFGALPFSRTFVPVRHTPLQVISPMCLTQGLHDAHKASLWWGNTRYWLQIMWGGKWHLIKNRGEQNPCKRYFGSSFCSPVSKNKKAQIEREKLEALLLRWAISLIYFLEHSEKATCRSLLLIKRSLYH